MCVLGSSGWHISPCQSELAGTPETVLPENTRAVSGSYLTSVCLSFSHDDDDDDDDNTYLTGLLLGVNWHM